MSEECTFAVEVKEFKATNLTSRNRFRDRLRLVCDFDDKKFKTKKELIGGGDVQWKFSWKTDYKIFSYKYLEERFLKITCMRSKNEVYGRCSVDLYTIATGPEEHNLPLLDFENKVVGRLNFIVEMPQVSNVAVIFKQVKLKHLKPVGTSRECNPYLKYTYSKLWPLVLDKREKAVYSTTQYNTTDPSWVDLPEVRFHASLKELLHESIVLHVTHHGKMTNTTLGRCNLLFRTLVDNGKTFKDEDLISFKGPLKVENAEIEGVLVFKFLPKFAQMKPLNIVKKAIHTEKGIFDALPLLPALPKPNVTIINSEATNLPEVPKQTLNTSKPPEATSPNLGRNRANTIATPRSSMLAEEDDDDDDDDEPKKAKDQGKEKAKAEVSSPKSEPKSDAKKAPPLRNKKISIVQEDLISFTPPQARRRQRSASTSLAIPPTVINPFAPQTALQTQPQVSPMGSFGTPAVSLQAFPAQQPSFNPFATQPFAPQAFGQSPFAAQQQQFGQTPFGPTQGFGQPQAFGQQQAFAQQQPTFNPFAPVNAPAQGQQQAKTPFSF